MIRFTFHAIAAIASLTLWTTSAAAQDYRYAVFELPPLVGDHSYGWTLDIRIMWSEEGPCQQTYLSRFLPPVPFSSPVFFPAPAPISSTLSSDRTLSIRGRHP